MKKIYITLTLLCAIGCEAVFEDNLSNESIIILAPLENTQVTVGDVSFTWESIDNADSYQIQIATPNFENANQILLDSITEDSRVVHNLDVGTYQWRVKGANSAYETPYSTVVTFEVN